MFSWELGNHFIFEHPLSACSWRKDSVCHDVAPDQCMLGLRDPARSSEPTVPNSLQFTLTQLNTKEKQGSCLNRVPCGKPPSVGMKALPCAVHATRWTDHENTWLLLPDLTDAQAPMLRQQKVPSIGNVKCFASLQPFLFCNRRNPLA